MPTKSYASYAEWKKDPSLKNQRLITALERIVERVAPDWVKTVKWGQVCCAEHGTQKVYIHTEEDHVQLGFYAGSKMKDPRRESVWESRRHWSILSASRSFSRCLSRGGNG